MLGQFGLVLIRESVDGVLDSQKDRVVLAGFLDESSAHSSRPELSEKWPSTAVCSGKSTQRDADETADPLDQ